MLRIFEAEFIFFKVYITEVNAKSPECQDFRANTSDNTLPERLSEKYLGAGTASKVI